MINLKNIENYQGKFLKRGFDFLYIPPHSVLQPYISCYTISFPIDMPDEYTILPTASSTIVVSVDSNHIYNILRGVNTKASNVGNHANKMKLLLLIEFKPGGLYPFLNVDQLELVDNSFALNDIDNTLTQTIENELIKSSTIETLIHALDELFVTLLIKRNNSKGILAMTNLIMNQNGEISVKDLSATCHYSERQIRRLFLQYIGTSPKMFARIVRMNHAVHLIQNTPANLMSVTMQAGYFDQPHFIHDFKSICGITTMDYIQNMSVFYNDEFKM